MRASIQIALKDLRLRIRDRSAFILGIAAPLILAFIFNLIFGGAFQADEGLDITFGIVDLDQSQVTIGFTEGLEQSGAFLIETYPSAASADLAIDEGTIQAYFLFEEGFAQSVLSGGSPTIGVVGDVDAPTSTQIAASIAGELSTSLQTTGLAVATSAALSGSSLSPEFVGSLSSDPSSAVFSFEIVDQSADARQLDPTTYFAAGMAVFFMFFTVQFGVLGLLEEEREGTMTRLLAAPTPRLSIVAGKGVLSFLLGFLATTILIAATTLLMGANWGATLGVLLLVIACVLAAVGIMGLVASAARTVSTPGCRRNWTPSSCAPTSGLWGSWRRGCRERWRAFRHAPQSRCHERRA